MNECPLCGIDFEGAECKPTCPMARGCSMVRCPRCGYEFVESGRFIDMLRRWIRRAPAVCASDPLRVIDLPVGSVASIAHIATTSAARMSKLASFGIAAGSEVRMLARRPAIVLACGSSSIAIDDEVAREIVVQLGAPASRAG